MRRTWPQRLLLGLSLFVIAGCLVTAAGLYYALDKFNDIPRITLTHVLTPPVDDAVDGGGDQWDQPLNFLLVGSDTRDNIDPDDPDSGAFLNGDFGGQRSDTIMILRLDPTTDQAAIISFPRDLWVRIAGSGEQRINTAYARGADVLIQTIQQSFGIPIHHYVEVDFVGFKKLVDAVKGVPVYFAAPARDENTGLFVEQSGCVTLSGEQALAYARSRHYEYLEGNRWRTDGTGDLGRIGRQQDFIKRSLKHAIAKGARDPFVLNDLVDVAVKYVKIDDALRAKDLYKLANRFRNLDASNLYTYQLPVIPAMKGEASVLLLQERQAQPYLDVFRAEGVIAPQEQGAADTTADSSGQAAPPTVADVKPQSVQVRVLNGSGRAGAAKAASDQLTPLGFQVVGTGDAERFDFATTVVRYVKGQEAAAAFVAAHLVAGAKLEIVEKINSADVVLVVGRDFQGVLDEPRATAPTTAPTTVPGTVPPSTSAPVGIVPGDVPCG